MASMLHVLLLGLATEAAAQPALEIFVDPIGGSDDATGEHGQVQSSHVHIQSSYMYRPTVH
jgi:hypothetical protein